MTERLQLLQPRSLFCRIFQLKQPNSNLSSSLCRAVTLSYHLFDGLACCVVREDSCILKDQTTIWLVKQSVSFLSSNV